MPVGAAARVWATDPIVASAYPPKVGVDPYKLQWEALKPFADAHIYIAGDTFGACTLDNHYIGWSEGTLLNSERLLTNYFGLTPYVPHIPMKPE